METLGLQAISLAPTEFLSDTSFTPQGTFSLPVPSVNCIHGRC